MVGFKDIMTVTPPLASLKLCRIELSVVDLAEVRRYVSHEGSRGARRDASVRRDTLIPTIVVQSRAAWTTMQV